MKKSFNPKISEQMRRDLESNNLSKVSNILSEEELYELVSIATISAGHSNSLVKKTFFSYIFFNHDKKVEQDILHFFKQISNFKNNLSSNNKRMISFFLAKGIISSANKAREEFLKTYGYKSRTRYIKKNSNIDMIKFVSFYKYFIKKIISGIRNPSIRRFPHIGMIDKTEHLD